VASSGRTDVHQHLWPAGLLDALRRRSAPPMMRGTTLFTDTEPPFEVNPADHDPAARAGQATDLETVVLSLSTPLGIEQLPPDEAQPLLDAYHDGVRELAAPFRSWASVSSVEPDCQALAKLLDNGFVGLQLPATALATPSGLNAVAELIDVCEQRNRPVLVHPGAPPRTDDDGQRPGWWPAVVDYTAQLQAAWWSWRHAGRASFPELRICFVAGAGLAPLQHERFTARGGGRFVVDPRVFVDSSACGRQAMDALTRSLGVDVIVLGSDRPYAQPLDPHQHGLGDAAWQAFTINNPLRLMQGGQ